MHPVFIVANFVFFIPALALTLIVENQKKNVPLPSNITYDAMIVMWTLWCFVNFQWAMFTLHPVFQNLWGDLSSEKQSRNLAHEYYQHADRRLANLMDSV
jgi:hypothetical protein